MPRYRVENRETKEVYEIEAPFASIACLRMGWLVGDCYIKCIREGAFTNISEPPLKIKGMKMRAEGIK